MPEKILISEIFGPTIQGEGALVGRPTVFVRTGGCDYRCSWCDTLYAVLPEHRGEWTAMTAVEIMAQVRELSHNQSILITLSGGNPALQPMEPLIREGHRAGYTFALETQGSIAKPWFAELDYLILSPKPPSSGMNTLVEQVATCVTSAGSATKSILKIVIFDEADYLYARAMHQSLPRLPVVLQIGTQPPNMENDIENMSQQVEWLLQRVCDDGWFDVTILPQLHVLLWGRRRGV